ncbi:MULTISPECIES: hypothetical protein [Bacillus]|uniref:hypothetical protein n=1 Tax=Bacillus TaxID=1386 RepID=UPI000AC1CF63|nr:hypothetical protein [Bacillus gobiensis]
MNAASACIKEGILLNPSIEGYKQIAAVVKGCKKFINYCNQKALPFFFRPYE